MSARTQESADHLLSANYHAHRKATTPESSHSGLDDYFTYISANQSNKQPTYHSNVAIDSDENRSIPQIRLAPPAGNLNSQDEYSATEDNVSFHVPSFQPQQPQQQQKQQQQDDISKESSFYILLDDIICTLFPTMTDWGSKSTFSKLSSLIAVPLVLVFTLTLPICEPDDIKVDDIEVINTLPTEELVSTPQVVVITSGEEQSQPKGSYLTVPTSERSLSELLVVEEEVPLEEEGMAQLGWCRWLVATQAICATTFVTSVMACKFI